MKIYQQGSNSYQLEERNWRTVTEEKYRLNHFIIIIIIT